MVGNQRKFQLRAFITFSIVLASLVILASGTILYLAPPGRIANWSQWTIIGLTKAQWQSLHTIFAALFVIIAAFHIYFNWKVIVSYLRRRIAEGMSKRRELALSSLLALAVFVLVLNDLPPFSTFMEFGDDLKNSWSMRETEPPRPHAELLTLIEFAQTAQIPPEELASRLRAAAIEPDSMQMTIAALAQKHGLSPQQLYDKIKVGVSGSEPRGGGGGGYGRKSVAEVCEQLDVPLELGLKRLRDKGIAATGESSLKDLALEMKVTPRDIAAILGSNATQ
jgi:hypothetical protein